MFSPRGNPCWGCFEEEANRATAYFGGPLLHNKRTIDKSARFDRTASLRRSRLLGVVAAHPRLSSGGYVDVSKHEPKRDGALLVCLKGEKDTLEQHT